MQSLRDNTSTPVGIVSTNSDMCNRIIQFKCVCGTTIHKKLTAAMRKMTEGGMCYNLSILSTFKYFFIISYKAAVLLVEDSRYINQNI